MAGELITILGIHLIWPRTRLSQPIVPCKQSQRKPKFQVRRCGLNRILYILLFFLKQGCLGNVQLRCPGFTPGTTLRAFGSGIKNKLGVNQPSKHDGRRCSLGLRPFLPIIYYQVTSISEQKCPRVCYDLACGNQIIK